MKQLARVFGLAVLSCFSSACTEWQHSWGNVGGSNMPNTVTLGSQRSAEPEHLASQPVLSSARQWEKVAVDVAAGLCVPNHCTPGQATDGTYSAYGRVTSGTGPCVSVQVVDSSPSTPFQTVLSNGVIRELVAAGGTVFDRDSPGSIGCDRIRLVTTVTQLDGAKHTRYYAGELTILAQGVVVVRNVARALSEPVAVGAVAAGEAAYWLSPSYLTRHPMAEVAISVSQVSVEGQFRAQYTNVYYIDSRDIHAYQLPPPPPKAVPTALYGSAAPHEVPLPAVPASTPTAAKNEFAGKKPFGMAGQIAAALVAASSDGSTVVGNVQFEGQTCSWHVAKMTASGQVTDLGTMGGFSAHATAASGDASVIVGAVDVGNWSAFKWNSSVAPTGQNLGHGPYTQGQVTDTLISADGTVVMANVIDEAVASHPMRVMRWASDTTPDQDPLYLALQAEVTRDPNFSCRVLGMSTNGHSAALLCNGDTFYTWQSPAKKLENGHTLASLRLKHIENVSSDLTVLLGVTTDDNVGTVSLDGRHISSTLSDHDFTESALSADGTWVGGTTSGGAALWSVLTPNEVVVSKTTAPHKARVVGIYSNGSLLLVNEMSGPAACGNSSEPVAYVLAPP